MANKNKGGRNAKKAPARDLKQKRADKKARKSGGKGSGTISPSTIDQPRSG